MFAMTVIAHLPESRAGNLAELPETDRTQSAKCRLHKLRRGRRFAVPIYQRYHRVVLAWRVGSKCQKLRKGSAATFRKRPITEYAMPKSRSGF